MVDIPKLMRGAEPQFYRGNQIGCLVTHGFMASPAEVGWAGQYLAKQGYTVYIPRLTGHGIDATHMERMRWQDWYAQVLDGYHILRQQCDTIIAVGHSMGGLLSLLLATDHDIDALVVSATPLTLGEERLTLRFAKWLNLVLPYTSQPSPHALNAQIIAEQEKRGEPITSRVHYNKWSSRAVHEFYLLEQVAQQHLHKVTAPLFLLYAEQDETGSPAQAQQIADRVRSTQIETTIIPDGGHIIFQDKGRELAFNALADYIKRFTKQEEITRG